MDVGEGAGDAVGRLVEDGWVVRDGELAFDGVAAVVEADAEDVASRWYGA